MTRPRFGRRDAAMLGLFCLPLLVLLGPALLGEPFYWGDLTYLHHPWRALPAEMAQRGTPPLWNPYVYFGMPGAAHMQGAAWYPGTVLFHLFPFAAALPLYLLVHFWLAGAFSYLWLRRLAFSRWAAAGAAAAFMLGGLMIGRLPFLNHVSGLALLPAFLLFAGSPVLLGVAFAAAFLSGYPPLLAGGALAAWLVSAAADARGGSPAETARAALRAAGRFAAAVLLAAALGAVLLLPALDLARESRRSSGIQAQESLTWSFAPKDFAQFAAPPLVPEEEFSATRNWWKTAYWGWAALGAAALGAVRLGAGGAVAAVIYLAGTAVLLLGGATAPSAWLWTHLAPLTYIRYPGTLAFLAAPLFLFLIAGGLHGRRAAPWAALAIVAELLSYAAGAQPAAARGYFTDTGPLIRVLRREAGERRYLPSPLALNWQAGKGTDLDSARLDFKHRLYGVTNMPYHLSSGGNFGEPLVPRRTYDFMDLLYRQPGLPGIVPWLGWADIGIVMTRTAQRPAGLVYLGDSLWHLYKEPGPGGRATWFDEEAGGRIPAAASDPAALPRLAAGVPLEFRRADENRFQVSGDRAAPGWIYVAEPPGPGWTATWVGDGRARSAALEPALTAFVKLRVPAGRWSVFFRYEPRPWRIGLAFSVLALCGLAWVGLGRLRRVSYNGLPDERAA
ncbi:MAG: hypothetical protein A2X36_07585 [Elusimicrobia bacterium GWA2_69_24]|nr:MAG: hypothetical protein A2X36_07585 [Elusimicrobia bacterium GWA2_69_24]HBL18022.1 hypothetical protein [Elusimicrobiota bacterium]